MIFCGETLSPGECKWVQIPVPGTHPLECICLCGKNPGQTLVVTAGVHGCEYVGVQALRALAQELDPSTMTGNVILLDQITRAVCSHYVICKTCQRENTVV